MADTQRTVIVANPGRRRRARRRNAGRRMTAKQIRFFGTPAQKSALKAKRRRNAAPGVRKHKIHRKATRRAPVKRNAGEIIGFTLANAGGKRRKSAKKGKATMAKTKQARRRRAGSGPKANRRRIVRRHNRGHAIMRHRRRRNPGIGGMGGIGPLVTKSAFAIAGALGSKLIPQMLLGANNTSWVGYLANAGTGFGLWLIAEKVLKNRNASEGIAIGSAVQIILRIVNDMTPFGGYLSQAGFGDYQAQAFVTPQVLVDPYNRAQIKIPGAWQPPPPPPPPTSPSKAAAAVGIGGYGGGDLYGGHSSLY